MTGRAAAGVHLIHASAGCGKTTRLTGAILAALERPGDRSVEQLVAMTYTRKAAAELAQRVHGELVAAGRGAEAARLPLARVGTIHAVCLQLLRDHAIDAGLSPSIEVVPGDEAAPLRQALERCIPLPLHRRMDALARRLEVAWDAQARRSDWLRPVGEIMELARSNRVAPAALAEMGERSASSLLSLLPPPAPSGDALDGALLDELEAARCALAAGDDDTARTREAADLIGRALEKVRRGELVWSDWARLARVEPARGSARAVSRLRRAAAAVEHHPRLHRDLVELTRGTFECARAGLDGYAAWKAERRLVDYTDMVSAGLDLIEREDVSAELAAHLALVAVDELQDATPLQVALLLRLHELVRHTVLVGDAKQCIFEYAGADPSLMEAVARWVSVSGGTTEGLGVSYRSRAELVAAANELFVPAFARFGVPRGEVAVTAHRRRREEQAVLPPLGLFWLDGGAAAQDAAALAAGAARLLGDPARTPIVCRESGQVRPVRPSDVAVLTATNQEAKEVARALEARQIAVALARPGLVTTPEGTLLEAGLRVLVDPADTLAGAVIDALTGWAGRDPDAYLAESIAARRAAEAGRAPAPVPAGAAGVRLAAVRARLAWLSPTEAVLAVLAALDAPGLCARWPDPEQRLGNLDALLGAARRYERRAARLHEPATVPGLLAELIRAGRREILEAGAADEQHAGRGQAVTVSTYHRAKGLEWPVVILSSLDRGPRRTAFDVAIESEREAFEPDDPLGGRWIRYWPYPFGPQRRTALASAAAGSPEGERVRAQEERERVRLLYVGFTRARDHLVLAVRRRGQGPRARWLDELVAPDGEPLVALADGGAPGELADVRLGRSSFRTRVWAPDPSPAAPSAIDTPARRFRPTLRGPDQPPPYRIAPSRARVDWPEISPGLAGAVVRLAGAPPLRGARGMRWDAAGRALHAFFAADRDGLALGDRLARARRLLARASLEDRLSPDWLIASADALRAFITARWPGAALAREVPVTAFLPTPHGRRRIEGAIDLLVDTGAALAVIDHKSFPAWSEAACRARARDLSPQLLAYSRALSLLDRQVDSVWLHFPLAGLMVEVLSRRCGGVRPINPGGTVDPF